MSTKDDLDTYMATVGRLEPDPHPIDSTSGIASIAISLKRIADALSASHKTTPVYLHEAPVMLCKTCHFHEGGACLRNPPILAAVERNNGYGAKYVEWEQRQPHVQQSDFCGEWRSKQ